MKNSAIIRIILYSLAIIVLLGILFAGLAAGLAFGALGEMSHDIFHHEESVEEITYGELSPAALFDSALIDNIEIEWVSGSVTVIPSANTHDITVSETEVSSERHKMKYKLSGRTLIIEFDNTDLHLGISYSQSKDLLIEVPIYWECGSIDIDTASARVSISDLTVDEIEFDGASGICNITNCIVNELSIETASGDIVFSGSLNTLECSAASANCKVTVNNVPRFIEMETASGNLELTLPEDCGFTCSMDTLSGKFESDFTTTHHNGSYVHGDGGCRIDMSAMSGDIAIRMHDTHKSGHHGE